VAGCTEPLSYGNWLGLPKCRSAGFLADSLPTLNLGGGLPGEDALVLGWPTHASANRAASGRHRGSAGWNAEPMDTAGNLLISGGGVRPNFRRRLDRLAMGGAP
jgi:hypothetical protein